MTQRRVSPLAEGAFLALIAAGLGALGIYFFPVRFLVDYIWGIPLIIIIKKHNLSTGLLTLATTTVITWLLTDPVLTLLLVVKLAPLALVYALLFKRESGSGTMLLSGVVIAILSDLVAILGFLYLANVQFIPSDEALKMQAQQFADFYIKLGVNAEQAKQLVDSAVKLTKVLIPSTLAMVAIFRAFFTYILATNVLRKLNYSVNRLPSFSEWRLPWYSIWSVILGLGMILAGDQYNVKIVGDIGKNLIFVALPFFLVIGIAVINHFIKNSRLTAWLKGVLVVIAVINLSTTLVLFMLIGMLDPLLSFRRWNRPKE